MCRRVRLTAQLAAEPRKHLVTGNELNFTALNLSYAASDHDPPRFRQFLLRVRDRVAIAMLESFGNCTRAADVAPNR